MYLYIPTPMAVTNLSPDTPIAEQHARFFPHLQHLSLSNMLVIDTSLFFFFFFFFFFFRPKTSPSLHSLTLDYIGFSFPLRQPDTYQSSWPRLVSASANAKLKA